MADLRDELDMNWFQRSIFGGFFVCLVNDGTDISWKSFTDPDVILRLGWEKLSPVHSRESLYR